MRQSALQCAGERGRALTMYATSDRAMNAACVDGRLDAEVAEESQMRFALFPRQLRGACEVGLDQ
eukprot:2413749-Pyramimonas_sp.AAC.1